MLDTRFYQHIRTSTTTLNLLKFRIFNIAISFKKGNSDTCFIIYGIYCYKDEHISYSQECKLNHAINHSQSFNLFRKLFWWLTVNRKLVSDVLIIDSCPLIDIAFTFCAKMTYFHQEAAKILPIWFRSKICRNFCPDKRNVAVILLFHKFCKIGDTQALFHK